MSKRTGGGSVGGSLDSGRVSTVSKLVAIQVQEELKLAGVHTCLIEFDEKEVYLSGGRAFLVRVARIGAEAGVIEMVFGSELHAKLIQSEAVQSCNAFFNIHLE